MARLLAMCGLLLAVSGCSDQVERFRTPADRQREPYCAVRPDICGPMSFFSPYSEVAKNDMTDFSAASRRHHRHGVKRKVEVPTPEVSAVKVPIPDVQEFIPVKTVSIPPDRHPLEPEPDDPLLTSYWPALEGPAIADPVEVAPIEPPARKASPGASGEGFWHTGAGKVAVFGLIVAFWAMVAGVLAWPVMRRRLFS